MSFTPTLGEIVELEVADGLVVRDPFDFRRLKTGDRVAWSTYFARRELEGSIVPRPYTATKTPTDPPPLAPRKKSSRTKTERGEKP